MELVLKLECPCRPGFLYKNQQSLTMHKKSKMHKTWEASQDHKQDRARSKEFENEIERLKSRLNHKEALEAALLDRIHQLEREVLYWKAQLNGVYLN